MGRKLSPRTILCVGVAMTVAMAGCVASPVVAVPDGQPGAPGPCSAVRTELKNPAEHRFPLVVVEPAGSARPYSGGVCGDDERPVAFIAHGYLGTSDLAYSGLIQHLVSNGFIVVFPGYTAEFNPPHQFATVDTGFSYAVQQNHRMDLSRVGVIGHSFGGGMLPWLVQRADARGWGRDAFWAVDFAPWYALGVDPGVIHMPQNMRFTMVNYEHDYFVDARIGNEIYASLDLPTEQTQHVMLYSDRTHSPGLEADHLGPVSIDLVKGLGTISTDNFDRWSVWRTVDATARCALDGTWCDTDLGYTGTWPDGTAVKRAVVRDDQPDVGPPALQECTFFINPRPCR